MTRHGDGCRRVRRRGARGSWSRAAAEPAAVAAEGQPRRAVHSQQQQFRPADPERQPDCGRRQQIRPHRAGGDADRSSRQSDRRHHDHVLARTSTTSRSSRVDRSDVGRNLGFATTDATRQRRPSSRSRAARRPAPATSSARPRSSRVAPQGFGLSAQQQIDAARRRLHQCRRVRRDPGVIDLVEPAPGSVVFFNIVGGTPPYVLKNETPGSAVATIGQHCAPGCTENSSTVAGFLGELCVGSPCQSRRRLQRERLAGSRRTSASGRSSAASRAATAPIAAARAARPTPIATTARRRRPNVCKDTGQSIAYIVRRDPTTGTHTFTVEDSAGDSEDVTVNVSFVCGNGVAERRGAVRPRRPPRADLREPGLPGRRRPPVQQREHRRRLQLQRRELPVTSPSPGTSPNETATPGETATPTPTPTESPTPTATSTP